MIREQITQLSICRMSKMDKNLNLNIVYTTNSPALTIKHTSSCFCAQFNSEILLSNLGCLSISRPTSAVLKQQHDIGVSFLIHLSTNSSVKSLKLATKYCFCFQKSWIIITTQMSDEPIINADRCGHPSIHWIQHPDEELFTSTSLSV